MSKATWLCGLASILALFACGSKGQGGGAGGNGGSGAAAQGGAGAGQGGAGQGGLGPGGAGQGGATGPGGAGPDGGFYKTCTKHSDCDDLATPCRVYLCESGYCDDGNPVTEGPLVPDKMPGNCHGHQCHPSGWHWWPEVDPTDVPADDGDPCTIEACTEGAGGGGMNTPAHLPAAPGTTCGQNKICDGDGACVDIP